jgi:hypothetical protein
VERRSSEHYKSGHECKGKIILAEALTIRDISLSGIQLETREYLTPNSICRIEITSSDKDKITPLCEVVWSNLMRTEKIWGRSKVY